MLRKASDPTASDRVTVTSRQRWLAQLSGTRVVGRCPCGTCPSIDLAGSHGPTDPVSARIVLQAASAGAILLLFIDNDRLSYLELAPTDPEARLNEFPPAAAIDFNLT